MDADASGRSRRGVLGCLSGALGGSWRSLGEAPRGPREALEASWRPLGGVLELLKRLGRLRGGFQGLPGASGALLEASWGALGGVLERSWTVLEAPWTPKGGPRGSEMALPRPLEQEISYLANSLIFIDFSMVFIDV